MSKRMGGSDYLPLVEHIKARLCSWTGRFLSYAGRTQLLRSVISSIISFWLSAFRLPKKCIQQINGLCSAFLWSGPQLNTRKSKVAWLEVCKPISEGGLGLRNIADSNKVSGLKLIWRLLSSNSLWKTGLTAIYKKTTSLWSLKQTSSMGSWIWRKLLKLRMEAKEFHRVKLGNGTSTSYWYDNWSRLGHFFGLLGARGPIELGIPLNSTVSQASLTHRQRNHRSDTLKYIFQESVEAFERLQPGTSDTHEWRTKDNTYTRHFSSRQTWEQIRPTSSQVSWSKVVWFSHSTPKQSFLTCIVARDKLPTGDRLRTWTPGTNAQCILCGRTMETRDHLFFKCSYSGAIWNATVGNLLGQAFTSDWSNLITILSAAPSPYSPTTLFLLKYAMQTSIYHIWRERNGRRHGKGHSPLPLLVKLIDKNVRNIIISLPLHHKPNIRNEGLLIWFGSR